MFRCESSPTWLAERWPLLKTPSGSPATTKVGPVCDTFLLFLHADTNMLTCVFSGYYTHIATLADVQENVMEYLHVLSRPMVINHDHDIIWTEAYMDTVVSLPGQSKGLKKPLNIFTVYTTILFKSVVKGSFKSEQCHYCHVCFFSSSPWTHYPMILWAFISITPTASKHRGGKKKKKEVAVLD